MPSDSSPLVLELQSLASDSKVSVATVVRKALIVSTKLEQDDFVQILNREINGYEPAAAVPPYRIAYGDIRAWNPYNGWIPVMDQNGHLGDEWRRGEIKNSIADVAQAIANPKGRFGQRLEPTSFANGISSDIKFETYRMYSRSVLVGVADGARQLVLDWALKLERSGIIGEQMRFTPTEKSQASQIVIRNFNGILGDVRGQSIQVGDHNALYGQLKALGISQSERNEIENILDELAAKPSEPKRDQLMSRGKDWITRNGALLGALAGVVTSIIERLTK